MFNFWHSGTLALRAERQSARMSEIKDVDYTWVALNTLKCKRLAPLHFKGLKVKVTILWFEISWKRWQIWDRTPGRAFWKQAWAFDWQSQIWPWMTLRVQKPKSQFLMWNMWSKTQWTLCRQQQPGPFAKNLCPSCSVCVYVIHVIIYVIIYVVKNVMLYKLCNALVFFVWLLVQHCSGLFHYMFIVPYSIQ